MRVTEATQPDEGYVDEPDSQTAENLGRQTCTQYPKSIEKCVPAIKILELHNLYLGHASRSFSATFFDNMHGEPELKRFAGLHIKEWKDLRTTAWLSCGRKLPQFPVDVYWFQAQDEELLKHTHYHPSDVVNAESLPLGMKFIDPSYRRRCDEFIRKILNEHTAEFRKRCFDNDETGAFLGELFQLMKNVKMSHRLIEDTLRLITVTYIMGRAITLENVSGLSSVPRSKGYGAARLISRQIKHPFHVLQKTIVETTTARLLQTLISLKGCEDLLAAFIGVIGLCMASEDQQMTYHVTSETNVKMMGRKASTALADSGCEGTEWFVTLVMRIFFHHVGDPREMFISDPQRPALVEFVGAVCHLVEKNYAVLVRRKRRPISDISFRNLEKNSSRLVSLFLLEALGYNDDIDDIDDIDDDWTVVMAPTANLRARAWWHEN
ncbi:hypothetical protein PSPO01_16247 [Paraphaeosphaeria sporulosa]